MKTRAVSAQQCSVIVPSERQGQRERERARARASEATTYFCSIDSCILRSIRSCSHKRFWQHSVAAHPYAVYSFSCWCQLSQCLSMELKSQSLEFHCVNFIFLCSFHDVSPSPTRIGVWENGPIGWIYHSIYICLWCGQFVSCFIHYILSSILTYFLLYFLLLKKYRRDVLRMFNSCLVMPPRALPPPTHGCV